MPTLDTQRVLALDIHPERVGIAVLEGPERLLDWEAKNFRGGVNAVRVPLRTKVSQLLSDWNPDAVILKKPSSGRVALKTKVIQELSKSLGIGVAFVDRQNIDDAFSSHNNKYERARLVVAAFPVLATRLPPKRKAWQSEHYQLTIFDAVALGLAYFGRVRGLQAEQRQAD
jgi:RNase H-fold protein (predicted Holliday junction resolvase)